MPNSAKSFAIATVVTLVALAAFLFYRNSIEPSLRQGERPTTAPREPFSIEYRRSSDSAWAVLKVDDDGFACSALRQSSFLEKACVLTTNLDNRVIASEAFGSLNEARSPVVEAIVWRGRLSAGEAFCKNIGLTQANLTGCTARVTQSGYVVEDSGLLVRVDSG